MRGADLSTPPLFRALLRFYNLRRTAPWPKYRL